MDEAPKAAWSPFPLTELVLLVAIVLLAIGFFGGGDRRGVLMGCGITLAVLAGGELAVREHFAGFRSHSALLAGICAVVAATALWFSGVPQPVVLVVAAAAFAFALVRLRRAFARRSGGLGFRA
jgi:hypothetical protein